MMRKKTIIFVLFEMILLSIVLVNSAPPFTNVGTSSMGISIEHPINNFIKLGNDHEFNFHLFNVTDGLPFLNSSEVQCGFHLYDQYGQHIVEEYKILKNKIYDWNINIEGENFTKMGLYPYETQCNNSIEGGFYQSYVEVNGTGKELTISNVLIYFLAIISLAFFFMISILLIPKLPSGNETDNFGQLISINNLKYARPVLCIIAWLSLMAINFIVSNISMAYGDEMITQLFFTIYKIMFWLMIPGIFIWIIFIIVQIFRDKQIKSMTERGIDVGSTP